MGNFLLYMLKIILYFEIVANTYYFIMLNNGFL